MTNIPEYVIGKVTGQSYLIGLFISVLKSPLGLILIVILPSLIIMTLEIIKVVKLLNEDKKKRSRQRRSSSKSSLTN